MGRNGLSALQGRQSRYRVLTIAAWREQLGPRQAGTVARAQSGRSSAARADPASIAFDLPEIPPRQQLRWRQPMRLGCCRRRIHAVNRWHGAQQVRSIGRAAIRGMIGASACWSSPSTRPSTTSRRNVSGGTRSRSGTWASTTRLACPCSSSMVTLFAVIRTALAPLDGDASWGAPKGRVPDSHASRVGAGCRGLRPPPPSADSFGSQDLGMGVWRPRSPPTQ